MTETPPGDQATLFPKSAGETLRETREAQGLSLAEVAARTRIPLRQLEAIEAGEYGQLPSPTYAIGFARAYARAVGADEVAIAREVRGHNDNQPPRAEYTVYEVADPSRMPSRGLAIAGVVVAVLLLVGVGIWYALGLREQGVPPTAAGVVPEAAPTMVAAPPAAKPTVAANGQVTLVATDQVWLRVYDAGGKTLHMGTMNAGDRYDVPADANGPLLNVGRPDKLQVLVNGSAVAPLGDGSHAIKDVPIGAAALAARAAAPAPAATTAAVSPASRSTIQRPRGQLDNAPRGPDVSTGTLNIAAPGTPQPAATGAP